MVSHIVFGGIAAWLFGVDPQADDLLVFVEEDLYLVSVFVSYEVPALVTDVLVAVVVHGDMLFEASWALICFFSLAIHHGVRPLERGVLSAHVAMVYFLINTQHGEGGLVDEGFIVEYFWLVLPEGLREELGHRVVMAVAQIRQHPSYLLASFNLQFFD